MKEKIRATDFTEKELPKNRWALYWDIATKQWRTMLGTSLLLTLFALPLMSDYLVFGFLIAGADNAGATASEVFALFFYASLIAIPCLIILFVGLSGSFYISKRLAFLDGVIGNATFFEGLRRNWKSSLGIGTIFALSFFLALVGSLYLLLFYRNAPVWTGVGIGLLLLQFLIVGSMSHYTLSQEALYENSFGATLKNGFLFALIRLPINVLLMLYSPGIVIALMCVNSITSYVAMGLFALFSQYGILAWTIYAHGLYDRFINKDHYPELVGKGLRKKED